MIICSCHGVSDRDILEGRVGLAGTDCGTCKEMIEELLEKRMEKRQLMKREYTYEETNDVGYDVEDCIESLGEWFKGKVIVSVEYVEEE